MRAVNLLPPEARRGGSGSPAAAYAVLGALAVALLAVTVLVLQGNKLNERKAKLAELQSQSAAAEEQARQLAPYTQFAELRRSRVSTVNSLAKSRFDWALALKELSQVIPSDVWLKSYTGTVAPGVTVDGGATSNSQFRSAIPNPAAEITGCGTSHKAVLRFVSRLKLMRGVTRVTLADSQKPDTASSATSAVSEGADTTGSCEKRTSWPTFNLVVFYEPLALATTTAAPVTPGAVPASTATTPSAP